MSEEKLDKLGEYYVYFEVGKRYHIPFYKFVELVNSNLWVEYVD